MTAPAIVQANKKALLGLVNQACDELALPRVTSLIGALDDDSRQWLAIANREGREYYDAGTRTGGWQELVSEHAFSTVAVTGLTGNTTSGSAVVTNISSTASLVAGYIVQGDGFPNNTRILTVDSATQITCTLTCQESATATAFIFSKDYYSLPDDFAFFNQGTYWDRGYRWQLLGPVIGSEWQMVKSGLSPVGPRRRFRIMNNKFYLDPPPSDSTGSIFFEYFSNSFCQSAAAAAQNIWTADTDYYNFDDDTFVLGLIWRYRAAKGLSFDIEKDIYDLKVSRIVARNGGNRTLSINSQAPVLRLVNDNNIPDSNYGQ